MTVEVGLDYISLTVKRDNDHSAIASHPLAAVAWRREHKGMLGYTNVRKCAVTGLIEAHSPDDARMGTFVQYSGDTLARSPVEPMEILFFHWLCEHKFTRVDIAVDIKGENISVNDLIREAQEGKVKTNSKHITQFAGIGSTKGATLYIGSPKSTKRMRVYDKAAEQGIDDLWIRFELQLRKEHAAQAAHQIATSSHRISTMKGLLTQFAEFENPFVKSAMDGYALPLSTPRKESKTRTWLMTQVAKAMSSYILDTGDDQLLDEFVGAVMSDVYEGEHARRPVDKKRKKF